MKKEKPHNKEPRKNERQVNQYDKILRENIEAALPGLIKNLLNIHTVDTEELPDDIQHTKERTFPSSGICSSCGYWRNCVILQAKI
jgi:hypothetical protein